MKSRRILSLLAILSYTVVLCGCTEKPETDPFGISDNTVDFPDDGGEKSIVVNTPHDCTLSCDEYWVTFSPKHIEAGTNTVTVAAAANMTTESRQATVTISDDKSGVSGKITIRQNGSSPRIDCETAFEVTYIGGTFSIEVNSSISWKVSTVADWITVSPTNGQAGKSVLQVAIKRLNSYQFRQSEIILSNAEYSVSQKISVKQLASIQSVKITYTTNDNLHVSVKASAFDANITDHTYQNGTGTIIFDRQITQIGREAFVGCTNLTSILIPNSVMSIGTSAFYGCRNLRNITIPDGVTSI